MGAERGSAREADLGLTFDQLKQDQIISVGYEEANRTRIAALRVWDRPEESIGPPGVRRLFVGKNDDKSVAVSLADAAGRARVNLKVDADGAAALEFLDENGKVVDRLPRAK